MKCHRCNIGNLQVNPNPNPFELELPKGTKYLGKCDNIDCQEKVLGWKKGHPSLENIKKIQNDFISAGSEFPFEIMDESSGKLKKCKIEFKEGQCFIKDVI